MSGPLRLPDELTRRALDLATGSGDWTVPPTRDASTVVLLRDGIQGPEVFLMRRVSTMAFAAGMYVFPGGAVDPDDRAVPIADAATAHSLDSRLSADTGGGAELLAAAARETFEECGALLVTCSDPTADLELITSYERWEGRRQAMLDGDRSFSELLAAESLAVDPQAIRAWGHWVTPEVESRRYDTRFFVAVIPAHQEAKDLGGEADRVRWMRPADALTEYEAGRLAMLPPTVDTLQSLLPFATAADVLAAAPTREIRALMPRPIIENDHVAWVIADARTDEVLYPDVSEPAGSEVEGVTGDSGS